MIRKIILSIVALITLICVLNSCGETITEEKKTISKEIFDPNSSLNTIFEGKLFSIPSPFQTAFLMKSLNADFDISLLNDNSNVEDYFTEYKQALNLGVYITDLGYSALYEEKNASIKYLESVEKLTAELGLDAAFDQNFLVRFEKNMGDSDSIIILMSEASKKSDNFLKYSNRKETSYLILAGAWIESIYFACELNERSQSPDIERRIAEQKQSLNSIIDILIEYNKREINNNLIVELSDLRLSFDKIIMNYEWAVPETDEEKNITTFHHELDLHFDYAILDDIKSKLRIIRYNIIKA